MQATGGGVSSGSPVCLSPGLLSGAGKQLSRQHTAGVTLASPLFPSPLTQLPCAAFCSVRLLAPPFISLAAPRCRCVLPPLSWTNPRSGSGDQVLSTDGCHLLP